MVVVSGLAAACSGDSTGGEDPGDRQEMLGIDCEASLSITGSFTPGAAQPSDVFGCWPDGVWTFHAQSIETDCPAPPTLLPEYSFRVDVDPEGNSTYTYLVDPNYERVQIRVSSGGSGTCEGGVVLYSPDGKIVTTLSPALQADNTIEGNGEYEVYFSSQW
jgi:hypothetical protein